MRLHYAGRAYGTTPAEMVGVPVGTWKGWIVNMAASKVGDETRAGLIKRAGMVFPTVAIE